SRTRWARTYGVVALAEGFAAAIREELDFRVEARNMAAMAATWPAQQRAVGGGGTVTLPSLYDQLSSEHVLVIEWLDGVRLRKAGPLMDDRGLDRAKLTRGLMRSMVYQLTEGGGVPRRSASGQHHAAHRRPARPARLRLGRPPRRPAEVRAAEPAARHRTRRPRGDPRRPTGPCQVPPRA